MAEFADWVFYFNDMQGAGMRQKIKLRVVSSVPKGIVKITDATMIKLLPHAVECHRGLFPLWSTKI